MKAHSNFAEHRVTFAEAAPLLNWQSIPSVPQPVAITPIAR
jgi:hypothetical protein